MEEELIKDYISSLLEEARNQGLFENLDDLACFLVDNGVTLIEELRG